MAVGTGGRVVLVSFSVGQTFCKGDSAQTTADLPPGPQQRVLTQNGTSNWLGSAFQLDPRRSSGLVVHALIRKS